VVSSELYRKLGVSERDLLPELLDLVLELGDQPEKSRKLKEIFKQFPKFGSAFFESRLSYESLTMKECPYFLIFSQFFFLLFFSFLFSA